MHDITAAPTAVNASTRNMTNDTSTGNPYTMTDKKKSPAVHEEDISVLAVDDKKLLRRIDLWICPMMALSMALQYLDKQALPAASILGLIKDLNLVGYQYSWANSVFYFGYLTCVVFMGYLMVRLPLGKLLVATFFGWAVIIGCHAAVRNFAGLMTVRFMLGAVEAAAIPCFSMMTGMWFRKEEHPLRHGFWFLGTSTGIMLAGLISFGIAHIKGGNGPWRWLFVALAILGGLWAFAMFFLLPDTPANARFLSPSQKIRAVERVNQTVVKSNHFRWDHLVEALTDMKIWLLVLFLICVTICNSSITAFSQIVLVGLGFNVYQANLLTIATGGLHGFFGLTATYICSRYKNVRCITSMVLCLISLVASLLIRFGPNVGSRLFGFIIWYAYSCTVAIALSLIQSNVAGFTKKAVATTMATVGYTTGNIIGPFLFRPAEKPAYPTGFNATSICFGIAIVLMALQIVVVNLENRKREQSMGIVMSTASAFSTEEALAGDVTDRKNPAFRYVF